MAKSESILKGKTGLLFHRNLIASLDGFGNQLSKEFQQETGMLTKCEFITRSLAGIKMRVRPVNVEKDGLPNFNRSMNKFLTDRLAYIQNYLAAAVVKTLGKSAIVETRLESGTKATGQWMGDSSFGDKKQDADKLSIDWAGTK